jgi:hypothetical protein
VAVDDRVDLIQMSEHSDGKPAGTTRRLERIRTDPGISRIQQTEGLLAGALFGHVTRVM